MLRTRLIFGPLMAAAACGLLWWDGANGPRYPGLFLLAVALAVLGTRELLSLFPADARPRSCVTVLGVVLVVAANWFGPLTTADRPWDFVLFAAAAVVLLALVTEVGSYRGDAAGTSRVAGTALAVVYLGVFPSFLVRLRWLPDDRAGVALLLAIFVPKCCDIGAYFTGRLIGRTPMAPLLSPKKTWEGFAGGMLFAVGTAVGLSFAGPVFRLGLSEAVAFGLAVGVSGVVGDLAESLMKRDARAKDASAAVPGFGGVLDVIDSVIFAAPVAHLFLAR